MRSGMLPGTGGTGRLGAALLAATIVATRLAAQTLARTVVFTHVTVVDMTEGPTLSDQSVVIEGNRIVALGPAATVRVPAGVRAIDGRGKYLIPGLWDMHAHLPEDALARALDFPLYLANGVTGIRNMWGDCWEVCRGRDSGGIAPPAAVVQKWKREVAAGTLLGPRIVSAGNGLDGPTPFFPGAFPIHDTTEAKAIVAQERERGADFLKVIGAIPPAAYFMLLRTARAAGIPVAGHVVPGVSVLDVSDSGQRSIEHLHGALAQCSAQIDSVMALRATRARDTTVSGRAALSRNIAHLAVASFSEAACQPYFDRLKRNQTWQVPTMVTSRNIGGLDDPAFGQDERLRYAPRRIRQEWLPANDVRFKGMSAEDFASHREQVDGWLRIVGAMARAGVPLLAGSDTWDPYVYPGLGLHDELEIFVKAGLTPRAALASATVSAARYFQATDTLGTIETGKVADLVLLDANPLDDIRNTSLIRAVVVNGRLLTRRDLDRLLAQARSAAQKD